MWLISKKEEARGGREGLSQGRLPQTGWKAFGAFSARGAVVWFNFEINVDCSVQKGLYDKKGGKEARSQCSHTQEMLVADTGEVPVEKVRRGRLYW